MEQEIILENEEKEEKNNIHNNNNNNKQKQQILSRETLSQEWGEVCRVDDNSDSDNSETSENEKVEKIEKVIKRSDTKSPHTSPMTRRLSMRTPSTHIFRLPEINELEDAEFLATLAKEIATFPLPPNPNPHILSSIHTNIPTQLFQHSHSQPHSQSQSQIYDEVTPTSSSSSDTPPGESPSSRRKVAARWTMVAKLARKLTSTDTQNNENTNKSKSKPRRSSKAIPNVSEDQYV